MDDERPYVIESPTRIRLRPVAKEMARMHGMSLVEMVRHLLSQESLKADGTAQRDGED
jgi:hypothetical protein